MSTVSYELSERIHEGRIADVYRGTLADGRRVIAKVLKDEAATPRELERFRAEYNLLVSLHVEGVARPLALVPHDSGLALIMRDIGGVSLRRLSMGRALSLPVFFGFAERICAVLGALHAEGCIHNDVCPANIVVNIEQRRLELIDLGIATRLGPGRSAAPSSLGRMEGSLPYMSPERTGRMNRPVDERSDLYSLGVTFYELLSGRLPFESEDAMVLVHAHLARKAPPLRLMGRGIPEVLCSIVEKLLEKNPEDRYESAVGVQEDLARCREYLDIHGSLTDFALLPGHEDIRGRLARTGHLYGRESELEHLVGLMHQAREGRCVVALISGEAGVGKTALVEELESKVVGLGGRFVRGRFSPGSRNDAYVAIAEALSEWCGTVASEPEPIRAVWRQRISAALQQEGALLAELVPELGLIIDLHESSHSILGVELERQRASALIRFVAAIAQRDQPVIMFLDDLHFADASSAHFLERLVDDVTDGHLLVVGAWRSDRVKDAPGALQRWLRGSGGHDIYRLHLRPLGLRAVEAFVRDAIQGTPSESLARQIHHKTEGNPYFVREMLDRLVRDRLVRFDERTRRWTWDIQAIEVAQITDNVVELLIARLEQLELLDKEILRYGAFLGPEFALSDFSSLPVGELYDSAELTRSALRLVGDGLLLPSAWDGRFLFAHDRIREAAHALVPEDERYAVQLQVARALYRSNEEVTGNKLFLIADHANSAHHVIVEDEERLVFARLNLKAGQRALQTNAEVSADDYFAAGLRLLPDDAWTSNPTLTRDLHLGAAQAAYVAGDYEKVEQYGKEIDIRATSPAERVDRWELQVKVHTNRGAVHSALAVGAEALAQLGVAVPPPRGWWANWWYRYRFPQTLRALEALADQAPKPLDPTAIGVRRILDVQIIAAAWSSVERLEVFLQLRIAGLLADGPDSGASVPLLALAATWLGAGQCHVAERIKQVALRMSEHDSARLGRARTLFLTDAWLEWRRRPLREVAVSMWSNIDTGLSVGDTQTVAHSVALGLLLRLVSGAHLQRIGSDGPWGLALLERLGEANSLALVASICRFVHETRGADDTNEVPAHDEDVAIAEAQATDNHFIRVCLLFMKGIRQLYRGDGDLGVSAFQELEHSRKRCVVGILEPQLAFFGSIVALQSSPPTEAHLAFAEAGLLRMRDCLQECPVDLSSKVALIQAELARTRGQDLLAMGLYDESIRHAQEARAYPEVGLANVLAARHHAAKGRNTVASAYELEAKRAWKRWGALQLEGADSRWSQPQSDESQEPTVRPPMDVGSTWRTTSSSSADLDVLSVVRASQALSAETDAERISGVLMQLLLENSGATHGSLYLQTSGGMRERARAEAGNDVDVRELEATVDEGLGPGRVVSLVIRAGEVVIVPDARNDGRFRDDARFREVGTRSVLAMPLVSQGMIVGVVFLENRLAPDVFNGARVETIRILAAQAAISLENARLLHELQEYQQDLQALVLERTRALTRAEKQTAALLDNLADGVITIDQRGVIEGFSAVASQMFGYTPEQVIGQSVDLIMPRRYTALHHHALQDYVDHEGPRVLRRVRAVEGLRKDGSEFPIEIAVAEVVLDDNRLFTGVVRDMTEQMAAEEALRAATRAAEDASRAKSVFLASMSHEIRTPLNAVLGFAQLLRRDPTLTSEARSRVELIQRSGSHLLLLINSILEMSKIEAGQMEIRVTEFELCSLLDDVVAMFQGTAVGKSIALRREPVSELPRFVSGDELKLRQILANLVGNAVKFTAIGGVTLRAWAERRDGGWLLVVEVSDTGPGIDEADLERIFEKFAQTEVGAAHSGTGLGLPISREYAQLLGGDIDVRSLVGHGSTFRLRLPLAAAESAKPRSELSDKVVVGLEDGHPPVKVLIVDDLEDNRRFLCDLLQSVGVLTCEAVNGQEAMERVEDWSPNAVFTDLRMPVLDGWEAIRRLRADARYTQLPIVAVSASVIGAVGQDALDAGANGFIMKPVQTAEVFAALERWAGVRFSFLDHGPAQPAPPAAEELGPHMVERVPADLRAAIVNAALNVDLDLLESLVDSVAEPELAEALRGFMAEFDYDQIVDLLRLAGDENA